MRNEELRMKTMRYMRLACLLLLSLLLLGGLPGCTPRPDGAVTDAAALPELYPDYVDVTIPCNVAPLNFLVRDDEADALCVTVRGETDSLVLHRRGRKALFPEREWHTLLERERGHRLTVTLLVRRQGRWTRYPAFSWSVVPDSLDAYITYRLIEPGYEVWHALQIEERCTENFDRRTLADNAQLGGKCMNCHIHAGRRGDCSLFYLRGRGGGALLNREGRLRKLELKDSLMVTATTYGDFHPDGRYGVFSANDVIPLFHAHDNRRLEVYDAASDLVVADFDTNRLIHSPLVASDSVLETFPAFSADGRWVYFCSAPLLSLPDSLRSLRYSLCRIAFDSVTGRWGNRVDTLRNARQSEGSVSHIKASPDGRYLLYCVSDYGTFPIWHRETALELLDLRDGSRHVPAAWNSDRSDTYHTWSSNSRWVAFASKRGDGQYGRVYFGYLDAEGRAHKPFVLPQADPEQEDLNLKSYNIPDLSTTPTTFDFRAVREADARTEAEPFTTAVNDASL